MKEPNKNRIEELFATFRKWNRKKILSVFFVALVVIGFVGAGFILYKQEQSKAAKLSQTAGPKPQEIAGWWLKQYFGSSTCEKDYCKPNADSDNDKLTNQQEFYYHSDPTKSDTNGNGLSDGDDIAQGFDPSKAGKVTFTEASSDDYIFGESLVLEQDVKKIITEMTDPTKVVLPEIKDSEIKIGPTSSKQAFTDYAKATNEIIAKYFPKDIDTYIEETISSNDSDRLSDLTSRANSVVYETRELVAPPDCVQLHKYNIGLFTLLPSVAKLPPALSIDENLVTDTDSDTNAWYDRAQAYMVMIQKRSIEENRLVLKYKDAK
jgi:hypothetical protein